MWETGNSLPVLESKFCSKTPWELESFFPHRKMLDQPAQPMLLIMQSRSCCANGILEPIATHHSLKYNYQTTAPTPSQFSGKIPPASNSNPAELSSSKSLN